MRKVLIASIVILTIILLNVRYAKAKYVLEEERTIAIINI